MKPIDDTKVKEKNVKLEECFASERERWKEDIIDLVESTKDTRKLAEAQVIQLSYRQIVSELIAKYTVDLEKASSACDTLYTKRFREYTLGYDIKLTGTEKQIHIQADLTAYKLRVKLLDTQIKYFTEAIKTLDNLGFAIRNKIEMVSQQML